MTIKPRAIGRVWAKRPDALPLPHDRSIAAFTKPDVFDRWSENGCSLRAAAPKADNVIEMYDVVGEDWWNGGGITAKGVSDQLKAMRGQDVEVRLNSPGGDMFEGIAVYNLLREHDGEITVKIMGMAASAASIIAMAGDRIEIGAASFMMIHNCWVMAIGNRHDMAETAEWLAPFDAAMAEVYAARTGQSAENVVKWMDAETYMSGSTAVERGFADALLSSDAAIEDEGQKARATETAGIRATEHALMASGLSRSQARAQINSIKGKPGAAPAGTQDAADIDWMPEASELLAKLKG